jgi:serine/threonine protein kinase
MAVDTKSTGPVSAGQFAKNLAESGFLDLADLVPDGEADGAAAARKLVDAGKLSGYQADALLAGRISDLRMGNYEILDRLGAGGMGTVYKARHKRMKRVVALKVLSKEVAKSKTFADRFQREVETIARLSHPNIVMAYDADEGEAGPFLVMEYVNGRDLASEVAKSGTMTAVDAVDRIRQAARGLEYAHARGIIHRDVKPGNLLRDTDGVVKVADLGLARLNLPDGESGGTSLTQAGTVFGTADYMSPEQAVDSGGVDRRADEYSLGCTLYFLLTGRPPYTAGSVMAVLFKHRDEPTPDLAKDRPDVPTELVAIFRRMMAKKPDDRYPSLTEAAADLEALQAKLTASTAATGVWTPAAPTGQTMTLDKTSVFDPVHGSSAETGRFEIDPTPPSGIVGLPVILVEPSRTQAGIIRRYLQQLGVGSVSVVGSGREALEAARKENRGAIVSAMHLSDMTGLDLARAVVADRGCDKVGVVLATSAAEAQDPASLPDVVRVTLMPKPFDAPRLAAAIDAVLPK